MRRTRSTMPELRLEMAPLIDVVFLLLTFFVFAMVVMVRAEVMNVTLPSVSAGDTPDERAAITLTLDAQGALFLDTEPIEEEALVDAIQAKLDAQPDAVINIAGDTECPLGEFTKVINRLEQAGIGSFQLFGLPDQAP